MRTIKIIDKNRQFYTFPNDAGITAGLKFNSLNQNDIDFIKKNYRIMENGQEGSLCFSVDGSISLITYHIDGIFHYTLIIKDGWKEISDILSKKEPSKKSINSPCTWEFGKLL